MNAYLVQSQVSNLVSVSGMQAIRNFIVFQIIYAQMLLLAQNTLFRLVKLISTVTFLLINHGSASFYARLIKAYLGKPRDQLVRIRYPQYQYSLKIATFLMLLVNFGQP